MTQDDTHKYWKEFVCQECGTVYFHEGEWFDKYFAAHGYTSGQKGPFTVRCPKHPNIYTTFSFYNPR